MDQQQFNSVPPVESDQSEQGIDESIAQAKSEPAADLPAPQLPPTFEADTKIFAALSYLSVLFVIPWIAKKNDRFVAFHVKQGMGLFIAEIVVWFILWLIESFLSAIFTYRAAWLIVWLYKLAWLVFGIVSLIGIYFVIKGQTKKLPYLEIITKNLKF